MRFVKVLSVAAAFVLSAVLPAAAQSHPPAGPGLVVNGKAIVGSPSTRPPHIHNDRLYASVEELAAAVGATVTKDEKTGAHVISSGKGIPDFEALTKLNPKLSLYQSTHEYVPSMGIHYVAPGPHVTLALSKEGTVNAFEVVFPAATTPWQPWFDQPRDQPTELPGLGKSYTQHIYVTDPKGLLPELPGEKVILDGRYLSFAWEPKPHLHEGKPYIPVRAFVDLLGGTIQWDEHARTATAQVTPKPLSLDWLKALNPRISGYQPISPFVPNMGVHHGVQGPHLTVTTDNQGMVTGFELVVPAAAGWQAWFDQPKDQPTELPGLGKVYTQHIYLVDPATIK